MKIVRAGAVQLSPVLYSREGTVGKVMRKIHQLGQQGVQFDPTGFSQVMSLKARSWTSRHCGRAKNEVLARVASGASVAA